MAVQQQADKRRKVVITNWVHPDIIDTLTGAGCEVIANRSRDTPFTVDDIAARAPDADAVLAFMTDAVDDAFLARLPHLQVVAGALKGYDNFDAAACARAGVWLTIVPDLLTVPTAELTVGLTIALGRKMIEADRYMRAGRFEGWRPQFYGSGIAGSTIGIVGMGAVGRAVARRFSGFEARLRYCDTAQAAHPDIPAGLERAAMEVILADSDIVVLTVPLTEDTVDLIDADALMRMKRGALLINPARGSLVDEEAVADALESGQLAGYAADVFELEDWHRAERRRAIPERLLREDARTVLTPHIGSAVDDIRRDISMQAALSILQVFEGRHPDCAVNMPDAPRAKALAGE